MFLEAKDKHEEPTEAELVRVDNLLGYILWSHYFVQGQGYGINPSLLYQDSMLSCSGDIPALRLLDNP